MSNPTPVMFMSQLVRVKPCGHNPEHTFERIPKNNRGRHSIKKSYSIDLSCEAAKGIVPVLELQINNLKDEIEKLQKQLNDRLAMVKEVKTVLKNERQNKN